MFWAYVVAMARVALWRQAALIPFYKEWREGISDWAMSSLDQAFDITDTGGQSWTASQVHLTRPLALQRGEHWS